MTLKEDATELIEQLEEKDTEMQTRMKITAQQERVNSPDKEYNRTKTYTRKLGKPSEVTKADKIEALENVIEHLENLNEIHKEEDSDKRLTEIKKIQIRQVNPEKAVVKDLNYKILE